MGQVFQKLINERCDKTSSIKLHIKISEDFFNKNLPRQGEIYLEKAIRQLNTLEVSDANKVYDDDGAIPSDIGVGNTHLKYSFDLYTYKFDCYSYIIGKLGNYNKKFIDNLFKSIIDIQNVFDSTVSQYSELLIKEDEISFLQSIYEL